MGITLQGVIVGCDDCVSVNDHDDGGAFSSSPARLVVLNNLHFVVIITIVIGTLWHILLAG